MEDILSLKSCDRFMAEIGRASPEYDELAIELNPDKLKRMMSIAAKIMDLSNSGFFGMSLIPDGMDLIMRVRVDNLFIEGENVMSVTPYLKMFQDVSEISLELVDGHILLEIRISDVYEKVDLDGIVDEIIDLLYPL